MFLFGLAIFIAALSYGLDDAHSFNPYYQQGVEKIQRIERMMPVERERIAPQYQVELQSKDPDVRWQAKKAMRDHLNDYCRELYNADEEEEVETTCTSNYTPGGGVVTGTQNCISRKREHSLPRTAIEFCYREADRAAGMYE